MLAAVRPDCTLVRDGACLNRYPPARGRLPVSTCQRPATCPGRSDRSDDDFAEAMTLLAHVAGFFGTTATLIPFFRQHRLQRLVALLSQARGGSGGAEEALSLATEHLRAKIGAIPDAYDFVLVLVLVLAGRSLIALSFAANLLVWFSPALLGGN
jgi:hypothetical protein